MKISKKLSPDEMRERLNSQVERLMKRTGWDKMTVMKKMKEVLKNRNSQKEKE